MKEPPKDKKHYRITIQGHLPAQWQSWFEGMRLQTAAGQDGRKLTTLMGTLEDQSALQGVLRALHGLGLTLLSVETLEDAQASPGEQR